MNFLDKKIEVTRLELYESVLRLGITHANTIQKSKLLDCLIIIKMKGSKNIISSIPVRRFFGDMNKKSPLGMMQGVRSSTK